MKLFDTCAVVAASSRQAQALQELTQHRMKAGLYPREIEFVVLGSGGGTRRALKAVEKRLDQGARVLMIHSGGESRRLPINAPEGKLFARLPLPSSSLIPPVLLDLQIGFSLNFPWKRGELVVAPGDVIVDFDTGLIPEDRGDICGFAVPISPELGSRHGVFKFGPDRVEVVGYNQRMPAAFLTANAPLEGRSECALDLGIVAFTGQGIDALKAIAAGRLADRGKVIDDLYLELLTACVKGNSFSEYLAAVQHRSSLRADELRLLFDVFSSVGFRAFLTQRTTFLHFGSLAEYPASCIEVQNRGLRPFYIEADAELQSPVFKEIITANCLDVRAPHPVSRPIYFENCRNVEIREAEGANLFTGLRDRTVEFPIPEGICLDERRVNGNTFLCVYHINDTFQAQDKLSDMAFCGHSLDSWLVERGLEPESLWEEKAAGKKGFDLLTAKLYIGNSDLRFVSGYWNASLVDKDWTTTFLKSDRFSLKEINSADDVRQREKERIEIHSQVLRTNILEGQGWRSISATEFTEIFDISDMPKLLEIYMKTEDDLLKIHRRHLLAALSTASQNSIRTPGADHRAGLAPPHWLGRGIELDQVVWARSPPDSSMGSPNRRAPPAHYFYRSKFERDHQHLRGARGFCRSSVSLRIA